MILVVQGSKLNGEGVLVVVEFNAVGVGQSLGTDVRLVVTDQFKDESRVRRRAVLQLVGMKQE